MKKVRNGVSQRKLMIFAEPWKKEKSIGRNGYNKLVQVKWS
jgi:hypothetical protein